MPPLLVDEAGALAARLAIPNELHMLDSPNLDRLRLRSKRSQDHVNDMLSPSVEHSRLRQSEIEMDPQCPLVRKVIEAQRRDRDVGPDRIGILAEDALLGSSP